MTQTLMTPREIRAAASKAADAHARAAGRTSWNAADYNIATQESKRLARIARETERTSRQMAERAAMDDALHHRCEECGRDCWCSEGAQFISSGGDLGGCVWCEICHRVLEGVAEAEARGDSAEEDQ